MSVSVGDEAPDFTLQATGNRAFTLSALRGRPVVLVFYPGDDTPICTKQLTSYSHDVTAFDSVNALVLAVSPQSVESHERFAAKHGLGMPLLADSDKKVGDAYGVVGPLGFYRRSVFVIDAAGVVRYAHRAIAGLTFRSTEEIVAAVRAAS